MITTNPTESSNLKADYNFGYIWLISIVAALGGLLFGYDWVVIGGAKPFFERYFHLTDAAQSGWANSCALIGCLVGALVAGALSDKFGRKRLLIVSAFLFAVTSIGNALAPTFSIFVAWRMLGGVAIGLASNLVADVYRGNRPGADARQAGFHQPAHHRHRRAGGAIDQLVPRPRSAGGRDGRVHPRFVVWPGRLALDVRHHRDSVGAVFRGHVFCSRKSALAGEKGESRKVQNPF